MNAKFLRSALIAALIVIFCSYPLFAQGRGLETEKYYDQRIGRYVDVAAGEVLVKFKAAVSAQSIDSLSQSRQTKVLGLFPGNLRRLRSEARLSVEKLITAYQADPNVEYVEPNFVRRALTTTPNDPSFTLQWGLTNIEADHGWDINKGTSEVVIAVIDSGMDLGHEDLINKKTADGYDWVDGDSTPQDENGHGTHVSGICAAETNNGKGVAGVSWYSKIMVLRVLDEYGIGSSADVISAINYAVSHGAKVINLSLGSSSSSISENTAVQNAHSAGCVIVAAAGNDYDTTLNYPASYANVISVAAVDKFDVHADYSNYNSYVDVCAPGGTTAGGINAIYSTYTIPTYAYDAGTSMSSPFVAGLAALIFAKNPAWTNAQVEDRIINSVDDLGAVGRDDYYGYGRINVFKALSLLPPSGFAAVAGNAKVDLSWSAVTDTGLTHFKLYRSIAGASFSVLATIDASTLSYLDTAVTNEITYSYKISSCGTGEEGPSGEAVSATPTVPPPTGSIVINAGAAFTNNNVVTLTLTATDPVSGMGLGAQMKFSNDKVNWSSPENFASTKSWTMEAGNGNKTVYVNYMNPAGKWMPTPEADTIDLFARVNPAGVTMISIPFYPPTGESLVTTLGITGAIQIARWEPGNANPLKYNFSVATMEPGAGYFLKVENNAPVECNHAYGVNEAQDQSIFLKAGWNQVGNPFDNTISWSDIRVWIGGAYPEKTMSQAISEGLIKNGFWSYTGGTYNLATSLEAGLGYWIRASRDLALIVPRPGSTSSALALQDEHDWLVKVSVVAEKSGQDLSNYFGVAAKADDSLDNIYDVNEPPAFGAGPQLYFINGSETLAVDVKKTAGQAKSWVFEVKNGPAPDRITVSFNDLPGDLTCKLIDLSTHAQTDLRQVEFDAQPNETRAFRIEAAAIQGSGPLSISEVYNYPNPFDPSNGSTGIRFIISRMANISIKIFDISGGLVRSLDKNGCGAGVNTFGWEGKDTLGNILANGVYFYLITARDEAGNEVRHKGKMAIWK